MSKYLDPRATQKSVKDIEPGDRFLMDDGPQLTATSYPYKLGGEDRLGIDTEHQMMQFAAEVRVWVIPKKK